MYNNPVAGPTMAAGGTLALTGGVGGMNWIWILLGAFALVAGALAIMRAAPKSQG